MKTLQTVTELSFELIEETTVRKRSFFEQSPKYLEQQNGEK